MTAAIFLAGLAVSLLVGITSALTRIADALERRDR